MLKESGNSTAIRKTFPVAGWSNFKLLACKNIRLFFPPQPIYLNYGRRIFRLQQWGTLYEPNVPGSGEFFL